MLLRSVCPSADRDAVDGGQVAEELEPCLAAAHHVHDRREPVLILRLDAQLALPLRVEQVRVRFRQLVLLHAASCCRPAPRRRAASRPTAVRAAPSRAAGRRATGDVDRQQDVLARQRLHLGRAEVDRHRRRIASPPPPPPCAAGPCRSRRARRSTLTPYFASKGLTQRRQVFLGNGGVEGERAFLPRRGGDRPTRAATPRHQREHEATATSVIAPAASRVLNGASRLQRSARDRRALCTGSSTCRTRRSTRARRRTSSAPC